MAKPDLFNHRKFKRLAQMLHPMPFIYVRAHLEAMWDVGYKDGNPLLGSKEDVESSAEWQLTGRKTGEWFDAVRLTGFIDELAGNTFQIHDLFEHAPEYVKKRKLRHDERRNKNLRSKTADNGGQRRTLAENVQPTAPTPAPAPKEDNPTGSPAGAGGDGQSPQARRESKPRKEPTGPHAELIQHFLRKWKERYHAKYVFLDKDGVAASKVLKAAGGDLQAARDVVDRYVACGEEFIVKVRHPLPMLVNQINRFTGGRAANTHLSEKQTATWLGLIEGDRRALMAALLEKWKHSEGAKACIEAVIAGKREPAGWMVDELVQLKKGA